MKTVVFVWNRKSDLIPKEDTLRNALSANASTTILWRKWQPDQRHGTQAEAGDRFFIMKRDRVRQGIIMSGFIDKDPVQSQYEWQFVLSPDAFIDWTKEPFLDSKSFPDFKFGWLADLEEAVLLKEDAVILELLWARHIFNTKGQICKPNSMLNEALRIAKGERCEYCGDVINRKYDVFNKPGDDFMQNYLLLCETCASIQNSLEN